MGPFQPLSIRIGSIRLEAVDLSRGKWKVAFMILATTSGQPWLDLLGEQSVWSTAGVILASMGLTGPSRDESGSRDFSGLST